jgi:cytochrome c oxidase subunit 2
MKLIDSSQCLRYVLAAVLPITLIAGMAVPRKAAAQSGPRVIEITAKRFGFAPNQITVKQGETVILRLKSEDVTHGFFTRAFKIDEDIEPGKSTDVTITPQSTGTYTIICDHFCGAGHGNMNMSVVVE